jgi:hypothetical protein
MLHYHIFCQVFLALCQLILAENFHEATFNELLEFDFSTMLKGFPDRNLSFTNWPIVEFNALEEKVAYSTEISFPF